MRNDTNEKRNELTLEESRERLRLANEATGIGTWSVDPSSDAMEWDSTTRDHWGFSPEEELSSEKLFSRTHPEDRVKLTDAIAAIRTSGKTHTVEIRVLHPDGSIRHLLSTGRTLTDSQGNLTRIIGTSQDITKQKKLEQTLREHAQGLEFLSSTAIRLLNPLGLQDIFKYIGERIYALADGAVVLLSEFDHHSRAIILRDVVCTDEEKKTVYRILGRDPVGITLGFIEETRNRMILGELTHVEGGLCDLAFYQLPQQVCDAIEHELNIGDIFGMPCSLEDDILGIVAILTHQRGQLRNKDLIESIVSQAALAIQRRRTEEELKNERNFFNTVFDIQGAIVAIVDKEYKIIRLNKAYYEMAKIPYDGMPGHEFCDIMDHTAVQEVRQQLKELVARGTTGEYESLLRVYGDNPRYIRWRYTMIHDRKGGVEYIVATGIDITDRIEAEKHINSLNLELRCRANDLEFANKELESFSYSVTHDLRNPVRAIIGFGSLLKEGYSDKLDDNGRDLVDRIVRNGNTMNTLIDDILNLSKVSRQEITIEEIDLGKIAEAVLSDLRKSQPERRITVHIRQTPKIRGDARLMGIVMANLVGNAWKYTLKTKEPFIEFGCVEHDGERVFYLRDNGAGFDMKHAAELFIPFKRLHGDQEFTGTGVGLATVARIINRLGGRIWANGETGKGATFYFKV